MLLINSTSYTVLLRMLIVLIPVVMGWILEQISPEQKREKRWRVLKLAVETAIVIFIGSELPNAGELPNAIGAVKSDDVGAITEIVSFLYGVVLVGLVGMMVADVVQLFRKPSRLTAAELDEERWQDNRQTLMDKVRVKWIDGVLNKSLYEQARIAVGLEEQPKMVGMEWQTMGKTKQELTPGTRLLDRFANLGSGGTLLILGEPGAGKTTLLLELAQDLLEATDVQDLKQPVPIVLNLSA